MAATRKLQSEVEKVFRKVEEGVEIFETIWDKVYSSSQQSQKEKYEADLKKEIKKLQRLRDQIKGWISQDSIKDKTQLIETRKLIESKMEQFKICEKETKTKAYSKEGLAREEKLDPREADKEEKRVWVNSIVEQLNEIVESLEADTEKLSNSKKDKRQKEQLERLGSRIEKNRWHIMRLEQINRLLDNDSIEPSQIDSIREDIEYYAECAKEDDTAAGMDDEYNIYEELQLDTIPMDRVVPDLKDSNNGNAGDDDAEPDAKDMLEEKSKKKSSANTNPIAAIATIVSGKSMRKTAEPEPVKSSVAVKKDNKPNAPAKPATATIPAKVAEKTTEKKIAKPETLAAPAASWASAAAASVPASVPQQTHNVAASTPSVTSAPAVATVVSPVSAASSLAATALQPASSGSAPVSSAPVSTVVSVASTPTSAMASPVALAPATRVPSPALPPSIATTHAMATSVTVQPSTTNTPPMQSSAVVHNDPATFTSTLPPAGPSPNISASEDETMRSPYMLPVAPMMAETLPPIGSRNNGYTQEMQMVSNMLRMSMMHAPPIDMGDKNRGYVPRNQYATHPTFPVHPPAILDNPALFERLPMDTLFLSFYYQQGSYQQVLAAKQLKKHSWRFHKKYMTWFQRHEEPKVTTDDYEEGTYVYFDYESGWCQRIKTEFKFEYLYLEDELNVGNSS